MQWEGSGGEGDCWGGRRVHRLNIPMICQQRLSPPPSFPRSLTHSLLEGQLSRIDRHHPQMNEGGRERGAKSSHVASEHFVATSLGTLDTSPRLGGRREWKMQVDKETALPSR